MLVTPYKLYTDIALLKSVLKSISAYIAAAKAPRKAAPSVLSRDGMTDRDKIWSSSGRRTKDERWGQRECGTDYEAFWRSWWAHACTDCRRSGSREEVSIYE